MMVLLTGGSGCGKSTYAEQLAMRLGSPRYYIAAMRPYGEESLKKIARHREMRASRGFETYERYTDLSGLALPSGGVVLLECMCNLTANEMFDEAGNMRDPTEEILRGIRLLREKSRVLLVVTNDVGSDTGLYDEGTREYIRILGRLNCILAGMAEHVLELVCGIPIVRKGELL